MEIYKEEKRTVEKFIYEQKKGLSAQIGRKMKQGVGGNRKVFWKVGGKVNDGIKESCSEVKDRNGRMMVKNNESEGIRIIILKICIIWILKRSLLCI